MKHQYRLYGWQVSFFAGKLRGYLNYKGLDYEEKSANAFDLFKRIPKKIGASALPALETRDGEWMGDTTEIITALEQRHPEPSITPPTPKQRIIALLLETWADDALIPIALNTRWSHPENYPAFREEGGKALFPFAPAFIRNRIIDNTAAKRMREASQRMGVTESQIPTLNQWTEELLDTLNQHLSQHKYLLGGKPCIADYSLTGLFYAHLNHDAWPERVLMRPRPALQDYTHRTHGGSPANESWLNSDSIADTLTPLLQRISREFIPMITATAKAIEHTVNDRGLNAGDPVPRTLKDIAVPMGDDTYTRHSFSYSVWMMQRVQNIFLAMSDTERTDVSDYLDTQGIPLATLDLGPPLKRRGLGTALA